MLKLNSSQEVGARKALIMALIQISRESKPLINKRDKGVNICFILNYKIPEFC